MKILAALCMALTGCASLPPPPFLLTGTTSVVISVREGEMLAPDQRAYSRLLVDSAGKIQRCDIVLQRYPVCLLHEVRHCIEGDWHPRDERNSKDC